MPGITRGVEAKLHDHVHVPDARAAAEAAELMQFYGILAASEAAARADAYREVGNVVHFCRWRQIERLITRMALGGCEGAPH